MERAEAEAIYDQGREAVVAVLLRMDEQIQQLTKQVAKQGEQIAELQQRLNRNSRNSPTPAEPGPAGSAAAQATRPLRALAGRPAGTPRQGTKALAPRGGRPGAGALARAL